MKYGGDAYSWHMVDNYINKGKKYLIVGISNRTPGVDPERNGSLFASIEDTGKLPKNIEIFMEKILIDKYEEVRLKRQSIYDQLPTEYLDKFNARYNKALEELNKETSNNNEETINSQGFSLENNDYETQKENIEKRKKEAEELHDNSILTASDNGFMVKESKYSYEIAKDLRAFIQKQASANQTGVIYKFKDDDNIYNYAVSTYDTKRGAGIGYVGYSVRVDKDTLLTDEEIYGILENNLNAAFDQKFPNKETWQTDKDTHINSIEKNNLEKIKAKYEIELAELDKKYSKNQEKNSEDNQDIKNEKEKQEKIDAIVEQFMKSISATKELEKRLAEIVEQENKEKEIQNEEENKNIPSKKQIPIATEIFNEERSIKDSSGNRITIGDIITQNGTNYLVIGFFEQKIEPRYIKQGGKEYNIYAELAEINKGKVNFNSRSTVLDGEGILKEKWQPKYNNGEIIKLGDIVTANVEKYFFEIYNKKLKIIGFSLDGRIDIEVIENGFRRPVPRELLNIVDETKENKIEGSYTTIGYADVILDGKLKTKYISSAPREDTVFEILKDENGNIKLGIWKGAEKRALKNPDFLDGTEKMKINNKPTQINVELGDLQKDDEGGYRLIKKPVVKLIDESYKG